jgi:hypothetical protein
MTDIRAVKIHPAIGIARVGNSPTGFFIGPEWPGQCDPPPGGYRDPQSLVKRQAARFRLFGYDAKGRLVRELTARDATVTWTVHLANQKAAARRFNGLKANAPLRNRHVKNRKSLIIDSGPRSLKGPGQAAAFDTGSFQGTVVPLGEIRTDKEGRLLVLGGFGHSASPTKAAIKTFENNDGWFDDVSDGPVTASVTLKGRRNPIRASGAWVIVAPPKFAPAFQSVTTLYDVLRQVAVDRLGLTLPPVPSFTEDVYPILNRVIQMKWVSALAAANHATLPTVVPPLGLPFTRSDIFERLKNPKDGSGGDMPMVWSDNYAPPAVDSQPVTPIQYKVMKMWAAGEFIDDWSGPPALSEAITPEGLDRAALEPCVGGPFYPGIEAGWFLRDKLRYTEPFRLSHKGLAPGDVTKQMSLPWQADFYACEFESPLAWWPAQRPDDVFPDSGHPQVPWTRDLVGSEQAMVKNWHKLGFIVRKGDGYFETERDA